MNNDRNHIKIQTNTANTKHKHGNNLIKHVRKHTYTMTKQYTHKERERQQEYKRGKHKRRTNYRKRINNDRNNIQTMKTTP